MDSPKFTGTLVVVEGPTASGKTSIAIELAKHFHTEIISADSRQVYREIPIGTAAPTEDECKEAVHHLVGFLSVEDEYNAYKFEQDALNILNNKLWQKDVVILSGGSGMYIDALCNGIDELPDINHKLRELVTKSYEDYGIEHLRKQLKELDNEYYKKVDLNNPKRLMRAVEVCLQTGKKYSDLRKNTFKKRDFRIVKIGLKIDRQLLIDRINARVDQMIDYGLLAEAEKMFPLKHLNSLNTVGFKELFAWMDGTMTREEAVEKIKTNTRRYAKRQMTWFRKDKEINWCVFDDLRAMIYCAEIV